MVKIEKRMAELKQTIGYWTALSISIGAVAGSTFFFGASIGAKLAGNMFLLAWIPLSVLVIYIAACFGELSSMFPFAGGSYEFGKQAYGRFMSFLIGWLAWLVSTISTVVVIVAALNALLPDATMIIKVLLSLGIIFFLNGVAYVGVDIGGVLLVIFAAITIAVTSAFIGVGFPHVNIANFTPLITNNFGPVFITMFFLIESFFGWEAATYLAEETKNARKTIPKAIIHATVIATIIGALISFVALGIAGWDKLAEMTSPITQIVGNLFGSAWADAMAAGVFLTLIGGAAGTVIGMPRLLLAMSRDRLFLGQFKEIHPRFKTPHRAVLFQTVITSIMLFVGLGNYQVLLSLFVPLSMILYALVIGSVAVLRFTKPEVERPFKAPLGKIGPLAVVVLFATIIFFWVSGVPNAYDLLMLSISLVGVGLPLYFLVELYYDPKAITEVDDLSAYLTLATEKITFPKSIRQDIFIFLGPIKGKTILEFGCGVGTLTIELLRAVGPRGRVIATHFSKNHIKITSKRIERADWQSEGLVYGQAQVIHDPEHFNRVHPDISYADAVVSVGMLGYIQDIRKVLIELKAILPTGGRICFVEYGDFFHLLPNVEWLASDKMIEKLFRDAGFSVKVVRERNFLWSRIYLYGIKFTSDVPFI
jgi:basic amino acid/polyamine antiporter, APA family